MGIKDLHKVIKKECSEQLLTFKFSELAGFRIVIDISSIIYRLVKTSENNWEFGLLLLLCNLRRNGITLFCIFDGSICVPEKQKVKDKRNAAYKKQVERLNLAKKLLTESENIQQVSPNAVEFVKTLKVIPSMEPIDRLRLFIEKTEKQVVSVLPHHFDTAKKILNWVGIRYFQSETEADGFCVSCVKNLGFDAVLSEDSDMLAYGCPLLLSFKNFTLSQNKLYGIALPSLLESLDMSFSMFVDFCILLSCDYNSRVSGYPPGRCILGKPVQIGCERALLMIREHKDITTVVKYLSNPEKLNIEVCKKCFYGTFTLDLVNDMQYQEPNYEELYDFLREKKYRIDAVFIENCLSSSKIFFGS